MAATVTLTQLISDVRLFADQRTSDQANAYVTDAEITRLLNLAIREELYDLLVRARGAKYFEVDDTIASLADDISTDAKVGRYALPANFYQLNNVSLEWAAQDIEPVHRINSQELRVRLMNLGHWTAWGPKGYRLRGSDLEIVPVPTSAVTIRIQYVPTFTPLASGGDTLDGVNGFEKLVALVVASELRDMEEQPQGDLPGKIEKARERLEAMAHDREAETPLEVVDTHPEGGWLDDNWPPHPGLVTVL